MVGEGKRATASVVVHGPESLLRMSLGLFEKLKGADVPPALPIPPWNWFYDTEFIVVFISERMKTLGVLELGGKRIRISYRLEVTEQVTDWLPR